MKRIFSRSTEQTSTGRSERTVRRRSNPRTGIEGFKTDYIRTGEIRTAMADMSSGKAPGRDGRTIEPAVKADILGELLKLIWDTAEKIPSG